MREYGFYWVIVVDSVNSWTVAEYSRHGWELIGSDELWSENKFSQIGSLIKP